MTETEARGLALADGIRLDQLTPEILRFYGYAAPAPTAGVAAGPIQAPEYVRAALDTLAAEAKSNNIPAAIAAEIKTLLGWAKSVGLIGALLFAAVLILPGCSSVAARKVTDDSALVVKALNDQHLAFEDAQVAYYRVEETKRVQEWYEKAVASVTVATTDGKKVIETNVAEALSKQRIALLQGIEQRVKDMRVQQAAICSNYATFLAYNQGMQAYFSQRATDYNSLKAAQDSVLEFLATFARQQK